MKKNLNISKASITIIVLNVLVIIGVFAAAAYGLSHERFIPDLSRKSISGFLLISIIVVSINSLVVIYDRYSLKRADNRYGNLKSSISQVESLNITLRAQRHDFLNQLQVLYSLLEMSEYQEAKDYIESIYKDILKVSRFLKTSSPAINALLQAKLLACEKESIEVELEVSSQLTDLRIPAWELCRVLSNLIDNSIYALKENRDKKKLFIEIFQDLKFIGVKVANNGPAIVESNIEKIFSAGFTTKSGKGEGMGLAIVKEIVESNGGTITVNSTPTNTLFEISIPR